MNKQYFKYLFKSRKNINIFLLIVNIIITSFNLFTGSGESAYRYINILELTAFIIMLECLVLPIMIFFYRFSKRAADTYFSLPITRKELLITSICYMVIVICGIHLIAAIPVFIALARVTSSLLTFMGLLLGYIAGFIVVVFGSISIATLIIFQTNTIFDAVVILGAYILLPFLSCLVLDIFGQVSIYGYEFNWSYQLLEYLFLPFLFVNSYTGILSNYFDFQEYSLINSDQSYIVSIAILGILGLIAFFIAKRNIEKHKAEEAEQISNHFFAYQFVITYITIALIAYAIFANIEIRRSLFSNFGTVLMLILVIFISYQIMIFVYRRKVAITKQSIIIFLVTILFNYGLAFVSYQTDGFGLSHIYANEEKLDYAFTRLSLNIPPNGKNYDRIYSFVLGTLDDYDKEQNSKESLAEVKHIQDLLVDLYYNDVKVNEVYDYDKVNIAFNINFDFDTRSYRYSTSQGNQFIAFSKDDYRELIEALIALSDNPGFYIETYYYDSLDYEEKTIEISEFLEEFDKEF